MTGAPCLGETKLFFGGHYRKAKELCTTCPMKSRCLADELDRNASEQDDEIYGVYGGRTPQERIHLLRLQDRRPTPVEGPEHE